MEFRRVLFRTAADKTYDGTDAATINSCTLETQTANHGVVSPDVVGCDTSNAKFGSAAAGSGKTVAADVALNGADKANYQLTSASASTTAAINKRNVTASLRDALTTYDGTDAATINSCTLETQTANHGVVSPDVVGCDTSNAKFGSAAAGSGKTVAADVALNGADKANYQLTSATAGDPAQINIGNANASTTATEKT